MNADSHTILILAETPSLIAAIEACIPPNLHVDTMGMCWKSTSGLLTPDRIRSCSLVVAELYRHYSNGIRAEGVALKERWQNHPPVLVISPFYRSETINCPGYWDTAAPDSLGSRIAMLLDAPDLATINFEKLLEQERLHLEIPEQH